MAVAAALLSCGGCASVCSGPSSWAGGTGGTHASRHAHVADVDIAFGRIFEARGDLGHAMAAYHQAARREPGRAEPYVRMAIVHDKLGQFTNSAAQYRRAIQLEPGNPEIFADVGFSLYLQDRWDDAEMNLRQALAIEPRLPRAHNNLALVLAHTGRIKEALAEFRLGGCSPSDAHTNVAFVATTLGHRDLAELHYRLAQSSTLFPERGDQLRDVQLQQEGVSHLFPATSHSLARR